MVARWNRFPWSERFHTSVAFGLGLSYATELPEVEVELEGSSHKSLIYWALELTAGPPTASWEVLLRLHHRSVAWGLMGEDGGVNALGLGMIAMGVCLSIDYRSLADKSHWIYLAMMLGLLAVLFFGSVRGGSRRWIDLGVFNLQP